MSSHRTVTARVLAGAVTVLAGCTYHNTIYNAGLLYDRAERSRRAGDLSASDSLYREVIAKTAEAYRARPAKQWAGEALYLLGRSRLRLGELGDADDALAEAERRADQTLRPSVRVYRAAVRARLGDEQGALVAVNEAIEGGLTGHALAEAHLLRGRWLMAAGLLDHGGWDLDRAAETDRALRVEAGLERLRWSVHHGDRDAARDAVDRLLSYPEGGARLEDFAALVDSAGHRWGPAATAELLAGTRTARWEREAPARARLQRARLLRTAGDERATEVAWTVAGTLGEAAAEARILLAQWHLEQTEDIADAYAVRGILLPAGGHPEVAELVGAVDELEVLTDIGLGQPLAWFAAAEVARDRLRADYLARGLFLAYADGAPRDPWVPKALLAAMEVSRAEGDRAWLRGRLEAHRESPYVRAAYGGPGAGFEALEEELRMRLRELRSR